MLHVLSSQAPLDWSMNSDGHMAPSPRVFMVLHTPPDSPHKCSADRNTDETKERVRPSTTRRPRVFDGIRVSIHSKKNRHSRNSFTTKSSPSRKSMQSRPSECQPSETKMSVPSSSSERDNSTSSQRIATKTNPWKRLTTIVHKTPVTPMYSISFSPWRTPLDEYSSESSAEWVPDTASSRCQTCLAAFGITRRRHHCRLCGGLVCNNCSLQRTFVAMSHESRRSRSANLSHRTCNTCATTLKNMATQNDSRVKIFHSETITETQKTVGTRYSERNRTVRVSWDRERPSLTKENRQQRQQLSRVRATTKNAPARHEEFEKVLQARSMSRGNSKTEQHVISSVWLEEWLKYVQFESGGRSNTGGYRGRSSNRNRPMIVRRPGPISNYSLLNFVSGVLEPKEDLQRNRGTEENGDYHVISREVWLVLLKMYGGGPSIHLKDVEVADQSQTSKPTALVSSKVALTASYTELGSKWVIKELNNEISNALADAQADTQTKSVSSELIPVEEQQQLAVHSTAPNFFSRKWLHNSKSARGDRHISSSALVLTSTSHEQENAIESSNERRRSFWKNWRSPEDNAFNKGTASTISQISEDVILFDPTKVEIDDNYSAMCIEESMDEINSTPNLPPTKSIAAISAFALAAAEARRKSTMSLMRHSSALMSQTNTMSA